MTKDIKAIIFLRAPPLLPLERNSEASAPGLGCSWGLSIGVTLVVVELAAVSAAFLDVFKAPRVGGTTVVVTAVVRQ